MIKRGSTYNSLDAQSSTLRFSPQPMSNRNSLADRLLNLRLSTTPQYANSFASHRPITPVQVLQSLTHVSVSDSEDESSRQLMEKVVRENEELTAENKRLRASLQAQSLFNQPIASPESRRASLDAYRATVAQGGEVLLLPDSRFSSERLDAAVERAKSLSRQREFLRKKLESLEPIVGRPDYMTPTDEEIRIANKALSTRPLNTVLIDKFNISVTPAILQCLVPKEWLNDEVINFYFQLLMDRSKSDKRRYRSFFAWNSFFWQKLFSDQGYCYKNVSRWGRKADVFAHEMMLVPINVGQTHWALGVVDLKQQKVAYWDSLGAEHKEFCKAIIQYLKDEWADKKGGEFPFEFSIDRDGDIPTQHNSYDCGVFTCMFAEAATRRGAFLDFSQDHIEECRLVMITQILRGAIVRD